MSEKNNETQSEWKKRELGALWRREGKNQTFLSGKIKVTDSGEEREISVVVFKNNYKENDRQPDFRVFEDRPRDNLDASPSDTKGANDPLVDL
tara:strand:+ start:929 stop:1207 length:279 start_codon:yes stop_codon:yes gene_type:complete